MMMKKIILGKIEVQVCQIPLQRVPSLVCVRPVRSHPQVSLVDSGPGADSAADMEEDPPAAAAGRAPDTASELGALLMAEPGAGPAVLHTVLLALTWADSTASLRACSLALPALKVGLVLLWKSYKNYT